MGISLAITSHNRDSLTIKSFQKVYDHPMISEIVIVDDCSDDPKWIKNIVKYVSELDTLGKIRISTNSENLGMMLNKRKAISLCQNEWVIILDSDNEIDADYLSNLIHFDPDIIYCPSFAKPTFDYRKFSGWTVGIPEAKKMVKDRMGNACFNTCNYLVHRDTYLKVFKEDEKVKGTDTISFNYQWLKSGRKFLIVPGMEYFHRVHDGSGFMKDADYNMRMAEIYKQKILAL